MVLQFNNFYQWILSDEKDEFVCLIAGLNAAGKEEEKITDRAPMLVTLGIDGIYGPLFEDMMENGQLPNFERARTMSAWKLDAHTFYRPHSLIVWSAFLYGREPTVGQKIKDTFYDVGREEVATRNHGKTNLCNAMGDGASTFVTTNWPILTDIIPDAETTKKPIVSTSTGDEQNDTPVLAAVQDAINSQKYTSIFAHLDYSDSVAYHESVTNGAYADALKVIDKGLGDILANPNLDFKNRDYLCITSDHGRHSWFALSCIIPSCWAPGKKHDCLCCETVKNIPVFVAGPGIKHHEIKEPLSIVDVVPSILSLMGKNKGDMTGNVVDFKG